MNDVNYENNSTGTLNSLLQSSTLEHLLEDDRKKEDEFDERKQWFHGAVTRESAETLLREGKNKSSGSGSIDGLFLVRGDTKKFALSLVSKEKYYHYLIEESTPGCFQIEKGDCIQGLEKIVEHYCTADLGLPSKLNSFCQGKSPPVVSRRTGYTNILHRAVVEKNETVVRKILNHPEWPLIDAKNDKGDTALHSASKLGLDPIVRLLLEHKADVNIKNASSHTPLHRAAKGNHPSIIHLLAVTGNAEVLENDSKNKWTPLHVAAMMGNLSAVKMLLDLLPCPYPKNSDYETPFDLAKKYKRTECLNFYSQYKLPDAVTKINVWFHPELNRDGAEKLLEQNGSRDGTFLIRKSSNVEGYFVLSLCHNGEHSNYVIKNKEYLNQKVLYIDNGPYLLSLNHLIYYYSRVKDGLPCTLLAALTTSYDLDEVPRDEDYCNVTLDQISSPTQNKVKPDLPPRLDGFVPPLPDSSTPKSPTNKSPPVISGRPPPTKTETPAVRQASEVELRIIKEKNIKLGSVLGEGEYGAVLKGVYTLSEGLKFRTKKIEVAVKTFRNNTVGNEDDFLREALVMSSLDHDCITKLHGICRGSQLMLVEEYIAMGSMLDFLVNHEKEIDVGKDLYLWAGQIAQGMEYLESKKLVHRDLAARNILLASKKQIKISDFGLSRMTGENSDYYQASTGGRWPIKWYAPESVNYGKFTHASDVWSYGITLWEMFSFGVAPYGEKKGIEVLEFIESGSRLAKPQHGTERDYETMKSCWQLKADKRPTFQRLCTKFTEDPNYFDHFIKK